MILSCCQWQTSSFVSKRLHSMLSRQMKVWRNVLNDWRTGALRLLILFLQKQWNQSRMECLQRHHLRYSIRGNFSNVVYAKGTSIKSHDQLHFPTAFCSILKRKTPASCMATIFAANCGWLTKLTRSLDSAYTRWFRSSNRKLLTCTLWWLVCKGVGWCHTSVLPQSDMSDHHCQNHQIHHNIQKISQAITSCCSRYRAIRNDCTAMHSSSSVEARRLESMDRDLGLLAHTRSSPSQRKPSPWSAPGAARSLTHRWNRKWKTHMVSSGIQWLIHSMCMLKFL